MSDWLLDGYEITSKRQQDMWRDLDWSKAVVDLGPSPTGNPGPYWHVPLRSLDDTSHRLYPKLLKGKWGHLVYQACLEHAQRQVKRSSDRSPKARP